MYDNELENNIYWEILYYKRDYIIKEIISRDGLKLFLLESNLKVIENIINDIIYPFIKRTSKL